jgi:hypothetical protein
VKLLRIVLVVVAIAAPSASAAPRVQLSLRDGLVWLVADGATVGQILDEWSRLGGTRIVNAERAGSGRLTIEMRGVPELQALDVLLRSTGGYIAAARASERVVTPALSRIARIVVLSSAPPSPAAGGPMAATGPVPAMAPPPVPQPLYTPSGAERVIGADGQPVPDDQDGMPPPPPPTTTPQPGVRGATGAK